MKKTFLALLVILCSCSKLTLPDNWREINAESIQNVALLDSVGRIDSEQVWNMAKDYGRVDTLILSTGTKSSGYAYFGTKAGIYPVIGDPADSYSATSAFTVDLLAVDGSATYTLGVYYTNLVGKKVELDLWKNFTKESFQHSVIPMLPVNITFYKHGTVFGFYLIATKDGITKKFYSERAKNSENELPHNIFQSNVLGMPPYLIHIEDGFGTHDYKEITIQLTDAVLSSAKIKPLDYDLGPWMVICEDYGSECDNDFNDVIFVVRRPNATKIVFELVAAGATRHNEIYLNNELIGEVHEMFGVEDSIMVNTSKAMTVLPYVTKEITVPKEFTMSSENMGGFIVTSMGITGEIFTNKKGVSPYMIVLPSDFYWTKEQVSILNAYPKFKNWAQDMTVDTDWYMYPDSTKIYR